MIVNFIKNCYFNINVVNKININLEIMKNLKYLVQKAKLTYLTIANKEKKKQHSCMTQKRKKDFQKTDKEMHVPFSCKI